MLLNPSSYKYYLVRTKTPLLGSSIDPIPRADIDIFTSTLFDLMNNTNIEKKKSTIIGDFNIDLLKYNSHEKTNDYVDNIFSQGFLPLITKPTRVTSSSATLIDHIYSNDICSNSTSGIVLTDVADHFGIFHCIQSKQTCAKNTHIKKRLFTERHMSIFKTHLCSMNTNKIIESDCPDEAYNQCITLYNELFNKHFQ